MRLANVNGQKIRALFVVLINLNDDAYLAAKRRSSKTPKHQHERPFMGSFADMKTANAIQCDNPRVRRIAAHFERATMHVRQGVTHHSVSVLRASRHVGQRDKSSDEERAKNSGCPFAETIHAILLQTANLDRHEKEKPTLSRRSVHTGPLPPVQVSIEFRREK